MYLGLKFLHYFATEKTQREMGLKTKKKDMLLQLSHNVFSGCVFLCIFTGERGCC